MSEVAEESEGWYRLRTVARHHHWSSDDEEGKEGRKDLRSKIKVCTCMCVLQGELCVHSCITHRGVVVPQLHLEKASHIQRG